MSFALFGVLACNADSPTDPPDGTGGTTEPATLVVNPDSLAFAALGDSAQLAAVVRDAGGDPVAGVTISWRSLESGVAKVNATGRVVARANGTTRVVASAGALADTVPVTVAQVAAALALGPEQAT
ncbi:MAG TPA: hypothetical protein VF188_13155, partial [Longimicrobiales bacterium]